MITGRIPELTIKFTEPPQNIPEEGKKVTIEVKSENNYTVRAEVNRKSLKKIVNKMDMWNEWVASLSGKMRNLSAEGVIQLDEAGINIFEIVPKEKKVTQTTPEKAPQQNQGKQQVEQETKPTGKAPAKNKPKAKPKAKPNVKEKIT
ncbi:MAG: hypothetical protein AAGA16_08570 [Cyanobacteria bacterium P01_E01_bin.35]